MYLKRNKTGKYHYGEWKIGIFKFSWRNIYWKKISLRMAIDWGW